RTADLTGIGQESGDKLVPGMPAVAVRESVLDLEGDVWLEPDSTESCDQRLLAGPILPDLEAPDESPPMVDLGANRPRYLRDGRLMLGREGLQERGLHHPIQPRKPEPILGEGVVLHDPAVFAAVQRDD